VRGVRLAAYVAAVLMTPWFFLLGLRELWRSLRRRLRKSSVDN
jgi:hypothetical protein